jgi:class 3 adenylate cyclase
MQFISAMSQASAKTPALPLEAVLEDLGYKRDFDEDDDSSGGSSSSFSFNIEGSTGSQMSFAGSAGFNLAKELRRAANSLSRFSTDLAHRCVATGNVDAATRRRKQHRAEDEEVTLVPWIGVATVMFIDLSGYSNIASHLTNTGGAHALSAAVNAYFETILTVVVDQYAGEVLNFAGDAIVACWPCVAPRTAQESAVIAAACALDLQRKCGMSQVQGTDLTFRLHIGITHGEIESQILTSKSATSMQSAYHFVLGRPLAETTVVDCAAVGEVCITEDATVACGSFIEVTPLSAMPHKARPDAEVVTPTTASKRVFVLNAIDDDYQEFLDKGQPPLPTQRSPWLETNLVPPNVAKKLRQGFKAAHVAEMRFLCVLFVKKCRENVNVSEWFSEIQAILDECRCPIVQILNDDKGTHLIAAVNLYQVERDPANVGITAANRLIKRETGSIVGVACGEVFCGITGSDSAGRWDVTGPAVVRACRLMQHAESHGLEAVLDESVYNVAVDISQLEELPEKIELKGAHTSVTAYKLAATAISVTSGIQSLSWTGATLHRAKREQLDVELLKTQFQRGVAVVKGPIGVGKRVLLTMALEQNQIGFLVHPCTRERRPLSILASLAEWYSYHSIPELQQIARSMHQAFLDGKLTKTLDLAHQLVDCIIANGISACIVVAYAQFLDNASLAFIKTLVTARPSAGTGRFFVIMTMYWVYGTRSVSALCEDLQRSLTSNARAASPRMQTKLCSVKLLYPTTTEEFGEALSGATYFQMREKSLQVLLEATGGCLALLPTIASSIESQRFTKDQHFATTLDGTIHITSAGEDFLMNGIYWPRQAPNVTARFTELYDALPPRLQLVLRVIASLSTTTGSAGIIHCVLIMGKLNSKATEEVVRADVDKLLAYFIIKRVGPEEEEEVACAVPAMTDVLTSLFTPDQDRLLKRHAFNLAHNFYTTKAEEMIPKAHFPIFASFIARLSRAAGSIDVYQKLIRDSWSFAQHPDAAHNVEKMQLRLLMEHRRFPTLVNQALFEGIEPAPLLKKMRTPEEIELDSLPLMPSPVTFGKDYLPPMALGAISGEMQKLCWHACNGVLDVTKAPERTFIPDATRALLHVDLGALMAAIAKFDRIVPLLPTASERFPGEPAPGECYILDEFKVPASYDDEKALLSTFQTLATTAEEAVLKCAVFRAYHFKVVMPRVHRMTEHVKGLVSGENMCAQMKASTDCVKTAFCRFLRPCPLPATVMHEALMDLATAGWTSKNFAVNLQSIRDTVLRRKTASPVDFKAFLYSMKLFGEEITQHGTRFA